ncbi:MAG: DNA repair protein RadA [Candidatus Kapabacteria bacterium]|nr:DNA repair protein RadA [Candidatus Kapabacteria bacterium]
MKQKSYFECSECGYQTPKWIGKCPSCGTWESFSEVQAISSSRSQRTASNSPGGTVQKLRDISTDNDYRILTRIEELDRVLGGGIVPGSLVLVGGDPGIGKSTLMLQMCNNLKNPLYVTGEESLPQIKVRAARLANINMDIDIMSESCVEKINTTILASDAPIVIIDSIQSIFSERAESTPGSVMQVRECASLLMQTAKSTNKSIIMIGHVTKDGTIAGPKILEHMVDTVLQFEGDKMHSYRILRALKNRYGSTNEIGIFEMQAKGMREVKNPSELFLAKKIIEESGIAITTSMEGSRPILLEVQALVTPSSYGVPQRISNGFDQRRLQMILSVLEKRLGLAFRQFDVFVNIAGGLYITDPAVDLALSMALVSSLKDIPLKTDSVFIGEVGLTGEIRQVSSIEQRINESIKLGFTQIYAPDNPFELSEKNKKRSFSINVIERISLALTQILA